MGQHSSKELARLAEVKALQEQAYDLTVKLEQAAGTAAAPWNAHDKALYSAAVRTWLQYMHEEDALYDCIRARREGRSLPMPSPTPPLLMPDPAAAALQPGTPVGGASLQRGQRGGGSSSKEGAPAGGGEGSEDEPLLAGEPGNSAPGLRRRQGLGNRS